MFLRQCDGQCTLPAQLHVLTTICYPTVSCLLFFFLRLRPFAKTTGDFLRIERVAETRRAHNAYLESSSLGDVAEHETNGAAEARPKDEADATMPWKLEVAPAKCSVDVNGKRSGDGGRRGFEQGMVLYNVRSGAQLHVR